MTRPERSPARYKPYLWAVGEGVATQAVGELVQDRYRVTAPHIWLDTRPQERPAVPDELPPAVLPYAKAHFLRLHVPGVHGVIERAIAAPILLLDNSPIHPQSGELFPTLDVAWINANPQQQLYWLWQIWELWWALTDSGSASSLLDLGNIHVEGWRVRVRQLWPDSQPLALCQLAAVWQPLIQALPPALSQELAKVSDQMLAVNTARAEAETIEAIADQLNELLLVQTARTAVRVAIAGATSTGPNLPRNEDSCYPDNAVITADTDQALFLGLVCDGVGGHEGGEVASQLAVQSLQLQLRGLLAEAQNEDSVIAPRVIKQQIEALIRVVNDLINRQNDTQGRSDRQRMGTTLVMAVVVPQHIRTENGWERVDELYIAHVGDSRAYWITPDYCHQLTVDDDIASREVIAGRQLLAIAQARPDAEALTQAMGTRSAQYLRPHIQRFMLTETGVLLLCSDGLSDNYRVEDAWANYIGLIVKDIVSLDAAVASWIELANQKNGHDNTAVVLMSCRTTAKATAVSLAPREVVPASELTDASRALLYGESPQEDREHLAELQPRSGIPIWLWAIAVMIVVAGIVGGWILSRQLLNPGVESSPIEQQN